MGRLSTHFLYSTGRVVIPLLKVKEAEVLVYTIRRPMEELPYALVQNRIKDFELFEGAGVFYRIVEEEPTVVSFGFAKQTLSYAATNAVDLIGIVPQASDEFTYMADAEKERYLVEPAKVILKLLLQ